LNAKFTKGVVSFDPNAKDSKPDAELASALINYVKAKIKQGAFTVEQLIKDLKNKGYEF